KLDEAVAAGKITQERADNAYARAEEAIPEMFARVPDPDLHVRPLRLLRGLVGSAAESRGIAPEELAEALAEGQTIAEVAVEHGTTADAVIADVTAAAEARIDEAVADGRLTAEQGERAKERAAEAIERLVNEGTPKRPFGPGGPRIRMYLE